MPRSLKSLERLTSRRYWHQRIGAGSGVDRPIVTNEIIAVDNTAGSYTCETDLITSVTPKPNTFTFIEEEGGSFASTDDLSKIV